MNKYYKGAVSLFIVVFFSLLATVIIVSFVRLTTKGLGQSTANDLSANAYDSAQAGVEDAKRALLLLCGSNPNSANCTDPSYSTDCNKALKNAGMVSDATQEVNIQISEGNTKLDQAYTCVTVSWKTPDYLGSLDADESKVIPLIGDEAFNYVKLEWFTSKDSTSKTLDLITPSVPIPLLNDVNYPSNRPSVMKTHFIKIASTFNYSTASIDNTAQVATQYLYPSTLTTATDSVRAYENPFSYNYSARSLPFTNDKRPLPIKCYDTFNSAIYACTTIISLGAGAVNPSAGDVALLQVTPLYNSSSYRVTLCNNPTCANNTVKFNGVQPLIDSNGRANDIFRRVQVRLETNDTSIAPTAAVETSGEFCKDFLITEDTKDYLPNNKCSIK